MTAQLPFGRYEITYFKTEDFYVKQIVYAKTKAKALDLVKRTMAPPNAFNFEVVETLRVPYSS